MKPVPRLAALLFLAAAPAALPAQAPPAETRPVDTGPVESKQVVSRQIGSATLENVPLIPADVKTAVQRYQNYREAVFRDWLPDGSILITTRFGATNQV